MTNCSECCTCGCGDGHCWAGHGDNDYYPASIEVVRKRIETGVYDRDIETMRRFIWKRKIDNALDVLDHNWTCLKNGDYTEDELNNALSVAIEVLNAIEDIENDIDSERKKVSYIDNPQYHKGLDAATSIINKHLGK